MNSAFKAQLERMVLQAQAADSAHDLLHCRRVLQNALAIGAVEGGDSRVLMAAAYLHDIANLPKNHPESHLSSERSAERARELLRGLDFPETLLALVHDAILCHSYSRGLAPQTLEGRVFQDADRLDALGAIGIARTFAVGGALSRALYAAEDPFLIGSRKPNDRENTLDHFYVKLFRLPETMLTETGRALALERVKRMRSFVAELGAEIGEFLQKASLTPTSDGRPDALA